MQQPEPGFLEWILRQIAWNIAANASTILITLAVTVIVGLGPIGRGLGQLLATLRHKRDALHDPHTTAALNEVAERLDFMERALVAVRDSDSQRGPKQVAGETRVPTPV
jgi:hypothetical protein